MCVEKLVGCWPPMRLEAMRVLFLKILVSGRSWKARVD